MWLRLKRTLTGVEADTSLDGVTWSMVSDLVIDLPSTSLAGAWCGGADASHLVIDQVVTHHSRDREWKTFGGDVGRTGRQDGSFAAMTFSPLWQATVNPSSNPPAIGSGLVLVSSSVYFGQGSLVALDLATGTQAWQWQFPTAYSINPAAFADGRIYVQQGYHQWQTQLWSFSAATGAALWTAPHGAQWENYFAPCPVAGGVYINGGSYGGMYGFSQVDGSQRFFQSLEQYDAWAPTYYNGNIYSWVSGHLRAHQPDSGAVAWSVDCGWDWWGWSMDTVPVIGEDCAALLAHDALHLVDISEQSLRWTVHAWFTGTPAIADGIVYAFRNDSLRSYNAVDGQEIASFTANYPLIGQPIVTDDTIIVTNLAETCILDRSTLAVRQTVPFGGYAALVANTLVIVSTVGEVRAYSAEPTAPISVAAARLHGR
jgi:large repetitive protein